MEFRGKRQTPKRQFAGYYGQWRRSGQAANRGRILQSIDQGLARGEVRQRRSAWQIPPEHLLAELPPAAFSIHRLEDDLPQYQFRKVLAEQSSALWCGVSSGQASLSS